MKRRRQYKKKAMGKADLPKKHYSNYALSLGFDMGYVVRRTGPKKGQSKSNANVVQPHI